MADQKWKDKFVIMSPLDHHSSSFLSSPSSADWEIEVNGGLSLFFSPTSHLRCDDAATVANTRKSSHA
jgi:hypothetical protein